MNKYLILILSIWTVNIRSTAASVCGCKMLRPCYEEMLVALKYRDEEICIEEASIGAITMLIYFKALEQYCSEVFTYSVNGTTFEGRNLYEVTLSVPRAADKKENRPVVLIDAGQDGGSEGVQLALFIIEQLVACQENNEMIDKVRWIILPCVNPDGMEYSRFNRLSWKKNLKPSEDKISFGVDISRNFDSQWATCEKVDSSFSPLYPGPSPGSEIETQLVKKVIAKYKNYLKTYLTFRRDGHALLYPYAFTKNTPSSISQILRTSSLITSRVNQRAGSVQLFLNDSIYDLNGRPHCGHSVDYAYDNGVPYAFEWRVFLGSDNRIMSKFQALPKGYEASLRAGYFSGIRELYIAVINEKRYGRI